MRIDRIEARFIVPSLKGEFAIGPVKGVERIVGQDQGEDKDPRYPREMIALQAFTSDGQEAWSTVDALPEPFYNAEWAKGDWTLLQDLKERGTVDGNIIGRDFAKPDDLVQALGHIVGHNMLKAGFANLFFDAQALSEGVPLYTLVGGDKDK